MKTLKTGIRFAGISTICTLLLALTASLPAQATTIITFDDFVKFHGSPDPVALTATIEDFGLDTVQITMDATALLGSDKVTEWYFNVALPGLSETNFANTTAASGADDVTVDYDSLKADGDGKYDILFTFPTSGDTFDAGEKSVWTVTYSGLDADDFHDLSEPAGGAGPYYTAVKLGNAYWAPGTIDIDDPPIPEPAPEPATVLLLGTGLVGLAGFRKKFKK